MLNQIIAYDPNQTKEDYCIHLVKEDKITIQISEQPQTFFKINNSCLSYCHFTRKHSFNPLNKNIIHAEYTVKKDFQSSGFYQLLFDATMPNGKRMILIKEPVINQKRKTPVYLIHEPEDKKPALAIFTPDGLLQVAILENKSSGLENDININHAFKVTSGSLFEVEFLRKEIVPYDMELTRSENNPFYIKKYCDWKHQIHLFFRITPKSAKNLIKMKSATNITVFKGPDIIIGDKRKIKINTQCFIPNKKPYTSPQQTDKLDIMFSKEREDSLILESQLVGARDKIEKPFDKSQPTVFSINNHTNNRFSTSEPIQVDGPFIVEVCRNDLTDKKMKKTIFYVDPSKDSNFKPTYLDPRIVNDYFFERVLITPTKNKEFVVGIYYNNSPIRKIPIKFTGEIKVESPIKVTSTRSTTTIYSRHENWKRYPVTPRKKPMVSTQVQLVKIEEESSLLRGTWKSLFS